MTKILIFFSLILGLSGCTGGDKVPTASAGPSASPKAEHFASDLERSLDQAKAVQKQLEASQQAPMQAVDGPDP